MSTCISRHGEYGEHKFDPDLERGADEFVCVRCWVFSEEAAQAEIANLRDMLWRVRALAEKWDALRSLIGHEQVSKRPRLDLRDALTPTTTADPERAALAEGSDA